MVQSVREWGFPGLANFPTSTQLTGPYRVALEAAGLGFSRELEMLARAKEEGLSVLGYAREPDEIDRLAAIRADLICIQLEPQLWVTSSSSLTELEMAANLARPIIAAARKRSPKTLYPVWRSSHLRSRENAPSLRSHENRWLYRRIDD